ncbi:hypothetical protein IU436_16765 [Nocardia farcinica]|uniref:Lipoprotein n=1 Tax=Nocardia farcinica TaxID=37329 RepID=A0A0H5NQN8_NOCFR|nr:hypothetical protein [Nocardia farcinica]AXK85747.1 hypothetical protein DXT66_08995 [Nocardia farcinica]MBA4855245.1 hypothetical protein [Nocardia farcinica]MBC9817760.1 hypothetical protein [Nocardia farcinica]MBF6143530.1 hypothetical protein [Nocardia farcinica]MBF6385853.1 hypothetical protein [Nocardia farcinica]
MPHSRWISRSPMLVAAAFAVAALSACGTSGDPNPAGSSGPTTSSATTTQAPTTQRPEPQVSEAAAQKLCDAIRPELSNFRVQGPTLGRVGLNLIVHPWGLQNGIDVLNNKTVVDTATSKSCPDVRQQAIEALEVPDLATVVVGL